MLNPPAYSTPTTEVGVEIAERNLREAFAALDLDAEAEDLVQNALKDPLALASDHRPIVRALCDAVQAHVKSKRKATNRNALLSLEHLKDAVKDAVEMSNDMADTHYVPVLRSLCIKAYQAGQDEFIENAMKELHIGWKPYDLEFEALKEMLSGIDPQYAAAVRSMTTWDGLIVVAAKGDKTTISDVQGMQIPMDKARAAGMDRLIEVLHQLYQEDIEDVSLDGQRSRFANYCLGMFPQLVRTQFIFAGGAEKQARAAFKQVVDQWREMSRAERNELNLSL